MSEVKHMNDNAPIDECRVGCEAEKPCPGSGRFSPKSSDEKALDEISSSPVTGNGESVLDSLIQGKTKICVPPPYRTNDLLSRRKILRVGYEDMFRLLIGLRAELPQFVSIPRWPELPKGCIILGVNADHITRCFDICIAHESFDPIADGCETPRVNGPFTQWEAFEIEKVPMKPNEAK